MMIFGKKGLTLSELLVGLIVTAIVVLMVAALGTMAYKSYNGLRSHSDVYNDSQFAIQLIREAVRESTPSSPGANDAVTIVGGSLNIKTSNCSKFNFYVSGNNLVYDSICGSLTHTATPIIKGVTNLTFTPCDSSATSPCTPPVTGQVVQVGLSGTKNAVSFNYLIHATGRNPWQS